MYGDCSLPDDERCPDELDKEDYSIEDYWDDVYHQKVDMEICHV